MTSIGVHCDGKRYTVKLTAMQKLESILEQVASQLKAQPPAESCSLTINGNQADLNLPFRFANITSQTKIEMKTGQASRLGLNNANTYPNTENGGGLDLARKDIPGIDRNLINEARPIQDSSNVGRENTQNQVSSSQFHSSIQNQDSRNQPPSIGSSQARGRLDDPHIVNSSQNGQPHNQGPTSNIALEKQVTSSSGPQSSGNQLRNQNGLGIRAQNQQSMEEDDHDLGHLPEWCRDLGLTRPVQFFTRADLEETHSGDASEELPEDFYEFGVEDYGRYMQGLQKKRRNNERGLMTSKLREKEEREMAERFPRTAVRIVFPNSDILQIDCKSLDLVKSLIGNVKICLQSDVRQSKWYLYTTPPKQVLKDGAVNLYRAGLCPAAKIYFGSESQYTSFLRPEIKSHRSRAPEIVKPKIEEKCRLSKPEESIKTETEPKLEASEEVTGTGKKLPKWMKLKK